MTFNLRTYLCEMLLCYECSVRLSHRRACKACVMSAFHDIYLNWNLRSKIVKSPQYEQSYQLCQPVLGYPRLSWLLLRLTWLIALMSLPRRWLCFSLQVSDVDVNAPVVVQVWLIQASSYTWQVWVYYACLWHLIRSLRPLTPSFRYAIRLKLMHMKAACFQNQSCPKTKQALSYFIHCHQQKPPWYWLTKWSYDNILHSANVLPSAKHTLTKATHHHYMTRQAFVDTEELEHLVQGQDFAEAVIGLMQSSNNAVQGKAILLHMLLMYNYSLAMFGPLIAGVAGQVSLCSKP